MSANLKFGQLIASAIQVVHAFFFTLFGSRNHKQNLDFIDQGANDASHPGLKQQ